MIEIAGTSFAFDANQFETRGEVAQFKLPESVEGDRWPVVELNDSWTGKSILLIINPELSEPIAIDASRITQQDANGLSIATAIPISPTLDGSAVTNAESGKLVGLLTAVNGIWMVAKFGSPQ